MTFWSESEGQNERFMEVFKMNNKVSKAMSRNNNTEISLEMLDTKSNACKVLKCLRFGNSFTVAEISRHTGLCKNSTNSAIGFIMKSVRLCDIRKVEGSGGSGNKSGATYQLKEMKMKCSEYSILANKLKGSKKKEEGNTSKPNVCKIKNQFTSLTLSAMPFIRGANGYGVGGIYVG